jgi:hypothetical protein
MKMARTVFRPVMIAALGAAMLTLSTACGGLGAPEMLIARAVPRYRAAAYKGLAGQTVGVMCWADRGIRIDNPYLQLDVALGITEKLKISQATDAPAELKGTTFPISPKVIAHYQEDHPEIEGLPITDTAAKFTFTRLIYIEVNDFATRSEASMEMYRGTLTGNIKVIEISKSGKAKIAYAENDIHVSYPKDTPEEGLPIGNDYKIYQGTIEKFTDEIVHRLVTYEEDPDSKDFGS